MKVFGATALLQLDENLSLTSNIRVVLGCSQIRQRRAGSGALLSGQWRATRESRFHEATQAIRRGFGLMLGLAGVILTLLLTLFVVVLLVFESLRAYSDEQNRTCLPPPQF